MATFTHTHLPVKLLVTCISLLVLVPVSLIAAWALISTRPQAALQYVLQLSTQGNTDSLYCTLYAHTKPLTSTGISCPGVAGMPVMKSAVMNVLRTMDLWHDGTVGLSSGFRSKCIGIRTTGIWLILWRRSRVAWDKHQLVGNTVLTSNILSVHTSV